MSVLVIAEHDNAALAAATLNTIAAARELDDDVHVLVAGAGCAGAADAAAKAGGVSKVRVADDAAYANQLAENLAALIARHCERVLTCPHRGHESGQERAAASRRTARRLTDIGYQRYRVGGHVRAAHLRRQRDRDRAIDRSDQASSRSGRPRSMRSRKKAAPPSWRPSRPPATAACRRSSTRI